MQLRKFTSLRDEIGGLFRPEKSAAGGSTKGADKNAFASLGLAGEKFS
jgi:hypothetical protein